MKFKMVFEFHDLRVRLLTEQEQAMSLEPRIDLSRIDRLRSAVTQARAASDAAQQDHLKIHAQIVDLHRRERQIARRKEGTEAQKAKALAELEATRPQLLQKLDAATVERDIASENLKAAKATLRRCEEYLGVSFGNRQVKVLSDNVSSSMNVGGLA